MIEQSETAILKLDKIAV